MNIRRAILADHDAIFALVPRISQAGTPPHRDPSDALLADAGVVRRTLESGADDCAVLVAEEGGAIRGFIHLMTHDDYYLRCPAAHVSDLVVAGDAEGRGIGRALIAAAEAWARERGYPVIDLNVEVSNAAARALYEKLGFAPEWTKMVKPL